MSPRSSSRTAHAAQVFKALGHPARVAMVRELQGGERCVCHLVTAAGLGWSTVSRHLAVLRAAGVVADERRGLQVYYRIALPCVAQLLDCLAGPVRRRAAADVRRAGCDRKSGAAAETASTSCSL